MQIRKTAAPALLLFALTAAAANIAVPHELPDDAETKLSHTVKAAAGKADMTLGEEVAAAVASPKSKVAADDTVAPVDLSKVNKDPGRVDAPVDGLDGKPHDGPGLYETAESGTGDVGISGGKTHVDIKNPPAHTGDHEIVENLPELKEGEVKVQTPPKTPIDGDLDAEQSSEDAPAAKGPVPADQHQEYVPAGIDTKLDPPVSTPAHLSGVNDGEEGVISTPFHSFSLSFIMILFSEVGDKTFLIAALMAMKHPRLQVFSAALSSLIVMSILSALIGNAVPTLIPKKFTALLAAGLFVIFGIRMIREGLSMEKGTASVQAELSEVEAELQEKTRDRASSIADKLEAGGMPSRSHTLRRKTSSPSLSDSDEDDYMQARGVDKSSGVGALEGIQNLAGLLLSPAWVQTFVMTFLGEWGDRSQIATIAMAAGQDYWYVTLGAISGHAICTGIAVIGGRMLASRISVRNVTLGGAAAFLVFGFLYFIEAMYS